MEFYSKNKSKKFDYYIFKKPSVHSFINTSFKLFLILTSLTVVGLLLFLFNFLWNGSQTVISQYGFSNILQTQWLSGYQETTKQSLGLLPFIEGTLVTSFYALIISIPLSIGISLFISQYISNHRVAEALKFIIELIAAIPSVIIGFWGILVLGPSINNFLFILNIPLLSGTYTLGPYSITFPLTFNFSLKEFLLSLHFTLTLPIFGSIYLGFPLLTQPLNAQATLNVFTATIALVIMITPIIVSITVAIMNQVPSIQKEAAFSLGATPWEMSRMTVIPQSMRGIIGAFSLGLGRALGETMAVTMLMGNGVGIFNSIFDGGYSLTTIIVNEWGIDSAIPLTLSALLEIALVLMIISLIVNIFARLLVKGTLTTGTGRMEL